MRGAVKRWTARVVQLTTREGEPADELNRKWMVVPLLLYFNLAYTTLTAAYAAMGRSEVTVYIPLAFSISFSLYLVFFKSLSKREFEVFVLLGVLCLLICSDLRTKGQLDLWVFIVVAMDMLLLADCHKSFIVDVIRALYVVYVLLKAIEATRSFGLYDVPSSFTAPHCDETTAFNSAVLFLNRVLVFMVDYALTKSFAVGMRDQQAKVEQSIQTAENVASALVRFDLELAERALRELRDVPALTEAFEGLLGNLHSYRPFLPEALFTAESGGGSSQESPPGRDDDEHVAVVFTDIKSSTLLWETSPPAMRRTMEIHNHVMRRRIEEYGGYEVKTIGDAFMVTFREAASAVGFGLSVQKDLAEEEWPEAFRTELPTGLLVRIGMHYGPVDVQVNPITSRADYFGPTVNTAARVEGIAVPGTVFITDDIMKQLSLSSRAKLFADVEVRDMGGQTFKGVVDMVGVYSLSHPDALCVATDTLSDRVSEDSSTRRPEPLFLQSQLKQTVATVAHVLVDFTALSTCTNPLTPVNEVLTYIIDAQNRTEGLIVSMCSSGAVVEWSTLSKSTSHATKAAQFAGLLCASTQATEWQHRVAVGLATGHVLFGNVGTATQRFVTTIGLCVEVAGALASAALALPTFALTGSLGQCYSITDDPTLHTVVREVDEWRVHGVTVRVHELRASKIMRWLTSSDQPGEWEWSPAFSLAVSNRDPTEIRANSTDPVALKIAEAIDRGESLRYPIPPCYNL